jgi:hypothetical protein
MAAWLPAFLSLTRQPARLARLSMLRPVIGKASTGTRDGAVSKYGAITCQATPCRRQQFQVEADEFFGQVR